ncbi:MAG: penicillin-binding protein [Lachnospiraceae bacterium]|nr:penicillin-binding protein [Lachnospiraceae bacterium]
MSMKKKAILSWCAFVVCLIATVVMWFVVDAQKIEYEEVKVSVVSAKTTRLRNKSTGTHYNFYEVMVEYNGETYKLENPHNTYQYPEGTTVKAYLANNGRLFANIEGISSSTPLAKVYFVCLFGSFGLLIVAAFYSGKAKEENSNTR